VKTEYEFIHFKKVEDKPKTSVWACMNTENRSVLGHVKWYGPWRQYCFFPEAFVVFHNGCLQDICHFIQQLKEERKKP
jgi:hypothetical protein